MTPPRLDEGSEREAYPPLPEKSYLGDDASYGYDAEDMRAYVDADRASRAALSTGRLGGEALTVWFGSMPESNGKANWTAILYRKGDSLLGGIEDGFTIARSEYHDRVRYDADCVRHLIGELPTRPDILAYDGDMKSPPAPAAQSQGDSNE